VIVWWTHRRLTLDSDRGYAVRHPVGGGDLQPRSRMTTVLSILVVLGFTSAVGAFWDRIRKPRRTSTSPSSAQRARAQQTLDYYGKVWDSTAQ
jgi:hypothetical protein